MIGFGEWPPALKVKISVIVPVLNEEFSLQRLLPDLCRSGDEVFVVDGGSRDSTVEIARRFPAHVVSSKRGRAAQMNAGALEANGDVLWFLHADSILPSDWRQQIFSGLSNPQVVGGAFRSQIDAPGLRYRFLDRWGALRAGIQRTFYGDQGIFVRRQAFQTLGGFREWPVLEDLDFSTRLRRIGKVCLLPGPLKTSARRWQTQGWWPTVLEHSHLALSYSLGCFEKRSRAAKMVVVVMAKAPIPGTVKTRLIPALTEVEAAALASRLLQETVGLVQHLKGIDAVVAVAPPEGMEKVREILGDSISLVPQSGGDLGVRLSHVFEEAFTDGAGGVIALGADHPGLPLDYLNQAVHLLREGGDQVVLGPTEDGGYYLIGLTRPHPELFIQMPWSTPDVFRVTQMRAEKAGLPVRTLPEWFDIDRPEDLKKMIQ